MDPELEPDGGAAPEPEPEPEGAVPLPMLGQLWVGPVPEPELELEPEEVPDEPELLLDPEPPLLVPVLVDGVLVEELEVALVPELPVEVEVVAASATNAPPVRSPALSAPTASTLRRRIFMGGVPFRLVWSTDPLGPALHTVRPGSVGSRTTTWACVRSYLTNR